MTSMRGWEVRGTSSSLAIFCQGLIKLASVSRRVCVGIVLWKIICVYESQWEIVLITAPNDGPVYVFVVLMHYSICDDGQVIESAECFVSYAGLSLQKWDPFSGLIVPRRRWITEQQGDTPCRQKIYQEIR